MQRRDRQPARVGAPSAAIDDFTDSEESWRYAQESRRRNRPAQSQVFLARFRTWMETHTDQVIIIGCLVIGFWLIASSINYVINS